MSNFGFTTLRLVNPYHVAFREARSAVGAAALLRDATEHSDLREAIADCELVVGTASVGNRELKLPMRRLEYGARLIRKQLGTGRVALLFGSEKFGLSNEDMSLCHWLMRIPTRAEHESMNLGQAVALCVYELARNAKAAERAPKPLKRADAAALDLLAERLMTVLSESGYATQRSTPLKVRRLVRRMDLTAQDAEVWLGMLRQIQWKIER